ncbi:hypothetical protein RB600_009701 [Gaeumannomyces tritici]
MAPPQGARTSLVGDVQPLPVIVEDEPGDHDAAAPAIPPRSARRSVQGGSSRSGHRILPQLLPSPSPASHDGSGRGWERQQRQEQSCPPPPSFAHAGKRRMRDELAEHKAELGGGSSDVVEVEPGRRPWLAGRGDWCRACLAALALVLTILGVGLGVGLGLRPGQRNEAGPSPVPPGGVDQFPAMLFPAGSYSFTGALTGVVSNCTVEPAAFGCYPFSTYNRSSPNTSATTFQWVIRPLGGLHYSISSSANPFAPRFANVSARLVDVGTTSERFAFNFTFSKAFAPTKRLTGGQGGGGAAATMCWYNSTVVEATVWTRELASYQTGVADAPQPVNATWNFDPWPFRFNMTQRQVAGANMPDCRDFDGRPVAPGLGAAPETGGGCACLYQNFDLG